MKIEMAESLCYSWLRHVKNCQIVQTNWKVSPSWEFSHNEEIQNLLNIINDHFHDIDVRITGQNDNQENNIGIFGNATLSQILRQGECDAFGMSILPDNSINYYAMDVAFHGNGLNYGPKKETIKKVIAKCARTAFCLYGYLSTKKAKIYFASPKINPAIMGDSPDEENPNSVGMLICLRELEQIFQTEGFEFEFKLIANDSFYGRVMSPILAVSQDVADTSELFMRSYQMLKLFYREQPRGTRPTATTQRPEDNTNAENIQNDDNQVYQELKVGQIARFILKRMLSQGFASDEEIRLMQTPEYSHEQFGLNYPLLVTNDGTGNPRRYYSDPVEIRGQSFYMCSEWFETRANDDRPFLLHWINEHRNTTPSDA